MVNTKIVNVVATASINQIIDLNELRKFKVIFHDSDVYGGRAAYFKNPDMQGRVSIFASGKTVVTGLKSSAQIEPIVKNYKSLSK